MLMSVRGLVIAMLVGATATAHAGKPVLAALAPASDARKAIAIGPAGEVYEPDGKGEWVRRKAGGTAEELVTAVATGGTAIAVAKDGTPFKLKDSGWSAIRLGPKARPIVGAGSRVLAAVGKSVFALDRGTPVQLADAPLPVVSLAASAAGAVITTTKGLHRLEGGGWKPVKKAPKSVKSLASDRWAIVDKGALDLKTMKTVAWPSGARIAETTTVGDSLVAVGARGKQLELYTVTRGKLAREDIPLDRGDSVIGVAADREGRVVVAAKDGSIAVRVKGAWTTTAVRVELGPPKPGPAPATCEAIPMPTADGPTPAPAIAPAPGKAAPP
jgi:hypothetical protein